MYETTAFLCGYFHRDHNVSSEQLAPEEWNVVQFSDDEAASLKRTFYEEYIDFFADKCVMMKNVVNKDLRLPFREEMYDYHVSDITIYQMPLGMTLFSIRIDMNVADLNAFTAVMSSLRMIDYYKQAVHQEFIDNAIMPIKAFYDKALDNPSASISSLIENGNKLRVFQIINTKTGEGVGEHVEYENKDLLLYQLGSEVKVTTQIDNYSPSEEYMEKILNESRISIFRNWRGLALTDTFTILAEDALDWLVDNWVSCYFRLIYIHSLFQKCYLFRLNKQLRLAMNEQRSAMAILLSALGMSESKIYSLIGNFKSFDQHCRFHKISYNFMPLEISKAIDNGLCISEELEQLDAVIEREKQRRDEANDKMVNTLLFILSTLTIGSAIWDFSCLLDQMFPYSDYLGSTVVGYRTVSLVTLLALTFVVTRLFKDKNK